MLVQGSSSPTTSYLTTKWQHRIRRVIVRYIMIFPEEVGDMWRRMSEGMLGMMELTHRLISIIQKSVVKIGERGC